MFIYKKKGEEAASNIRREILLSSSYINQRLFATIALVLAEEVVLNVLAGDPMAVKSIQQAKELAEKEDFDRISLIATDHLEREVTTNDLKSRARLFLHKAINFAAEELESEEYPDFFEIFASDGFTILYESDPSLDWKERIRKKIPL